VKIEGMLFAIGTLFFGVVTTAYWFMSGEVVGTTVLALTTGLAFLIGFYLLYTGKRVGDRPEDLLDGEIPDADPDYGFFSPNSWWPLPLAGSAAVIGLGFVFAAWMVVMGVMLLMLSLIGFVFEYYRGAWAE
jgi:hypothetical protein